MKTFIPYLHLEIFKISIALLLVLYGSLYPIGRAGVTTPFQGGNYHALVIGNNDYKDEEGAWKPLNNPINDAISVVDVLKQRYAFSEGNVRLVIDATRSDILRALNAIIKQVNVNDSVLVFYAGHGYLNEDTDEAYWIPVDAQGMDESNYLSHDTIKRKLGVIADKASHVLLVSDSCFSGAIVRGFKEVPDTSPPDYYKKKANRKSIQIVAAGGNEFVDDDFRNTGHSPFTHFFLNELKNNTNQYLAVSEFVTAIEKNVANNVKQTPVLGRLYGAGDEYGEFIFTQTKFTEEETQREIIQILRSAEQFFRKKDYIKPPGNNARSRFEEVLRLERENKLARMGLTRIAQQFVETAKSQIANKQFDEAEESLKIAEDVKPNLLQIKAVRESLVKARDYVTPPIITW